MFLIRSSQIVKRFLKYFRISFVYLEGVGERDKRGNDLKSLFIYLLATLSCAVEKLACENFKNSKNYISYNNYIRLSKKYQA